MMWMWSLSFDIGSTSLKNRELNPSDYIIMKSSAHPRPIPIALELRERQIGRSFLPALPKHAGGGLIQLKKRVDWTRFTGEKQRRLKGLCGTDNITNQCPNKTTNPLKWRQGHPPAGRTPWRSVLPQWSAERSRAPAVGSPKWVAGGTPPRSLKRSGCWRSPSASPNWAPSRTIRSGPWTLRRNVRVIDLASTQRWELNQAGTHRVVKVFDGELSKALVNQVQFTFSCNRFEPDETSCWHEALFTRTLVRIANKLPPFTNLLQVRISTSVCKVVNTPGNYSILTLLMKALKVGEIEWKWSLYLNAPFQCYFWLTGSAGPPQLVIQTGFISPLLIISLLFVSYNYIHRQFNHELNH